MSSLLTCGRTYLFRPAFDSKYFFNSRIRIAIEYRPLYAIPSHPLRFSHSIAHSQKIEKGGIENGDK